MRDLISVFKSNSSRENPLQALGVAAKNTAPKTQINALAADSDFTLCVVFEFERIKVEEKRHMPPFYFEISSGDLRVSGLQQ